MPRLTPSSLIIASLMMTLMRSPAFAEAAAPDSFMDAIITGTSLSSLKLRYEHVTQDGLQPLITVGTHPNPRANNNLDQGSAMTFRTLLGWKTASYQQFSFTGQLINVSKVLDQYNDGTNGNMINATSNDPSNIGRAKIVDPDITEINQLYIDWTGIENTRLRLGRQQINLDNLRFVADIDFRQIQQVFDGLTILNKSIAGTEIYLGHIERVRQFTTALRDNGALEIMHLKTQLSAQDTVSAYAYLSSFDDLGFGRAWFGNASANAGINEGKNGGSNQEADQGNKILGLKFDGARPLLNDWQSLYNAEYARQSSYSGGDSRIDAYYYKLGGGFAHGAWSLRADQELLSSNAGRYGFQMPFGANHLFQGWADKFSATPPEGIRDSYITLGYKGADVSLFLDYHVLDSDNQFHTVGAGSGSKLGREWNVALKYTLNAHWVAKCEYASFREGDHYALLPMGNTIAGNRGRFRDTEKTWLTLVYSF